MSEVPKGQDWLRDYRVAQGGLMRCCMESLDRQLRAMTERPKDGTVLDCEFEKAGNGNLVLDGLIWRWNRPGTQRQ
jgi:hypothetical protein